MIISEPVFSHSNRESENLIQTLDCQCSELASSYENISLSEQKSPFICLMRIDKRKGLNEVTQQGSHSSQHVIFSSELSSYIMRVYTKSIHCCSLNLIPSILVQLSIRNITFEWEVYILANYLLFLYFWINHQKPTECLLRSSFINWPRKTYYYWNSNNHV